MSEEADKRPSGDPGLAALLMMLRFHGIAADGAQTGIGWAALWSGCQDHPRHPRVRPQGPRAQNQLAAAREDPVAGHSTAARWRVCHPRQGTGPRSCRDTGGCGSGQGSRRPDPGAVSAVGAAADHDPYELEEAWDGRVVLMARRATLVISAGTSTSAGFWGRCTKYRRLLGEVLVASFSCSSLA